MVIKQGAVMPESMVSALLVEDANVKTSASCFRFEVEKHRKFNFSFSARSAEAA